MKCLNDVEIQLVADDEAPADLAGHIASCERCATRLAARREEMHRLTALMSGRDLPAAIDARVRRAIERAPARSGGATTLRADAPAPRRVAIGWLSALGTAAVVAIVVFAVLPRAGAPTTLSASEVLGRSLQSLSAASGVERLEYELIASPGEAGPHRIEHLIDHDRPGRYRLARYGPDGAVVSAASQDPVTGHRMHFVRVDGQSYVIDLKTAQLDLALPQMGKALVESAITMMQAMSPQSLSLQDTAEGRQYVIELPAATASSGASMFDLHQARAVIDERDYSILAFEARGTFLKQAYAISFKRNQRTIRPSASVAPEEFLIVPGPGDIVIEGDGSADPVHAVLTAALRELARQRGR